MDSTSPERRITARTVMLFPFKIVLEVSTVVVGVPIVLACVAGVYTTRQVKRIFQPILQRLLLAHRIRVLPFVNTRVLGKPPPPPSIATVDILSLIVPYLSRRDLVSCCQASRLFFEVAGRQLCSGPEGVVVGHALYYERGLVDVMEDSGKPVQMEDFVERFKGSFFGELEPPPPEGDDFDPIDSFFDGSRPHPFHSVPLPATYLHPQPSLTKLQLCQYIRHIIYVARSDLHAFDAIDSSGLFPSLHTLTIQPGTLTCPAKWKDPFLSNLTPRHIRITRIPSLGVDHLHCVGKCLHNVDLTSRERVEKVTIQISDHQLEERLPNVLQVLFPASVDQIDLVFLIPDLLDPMTGPEALEQQKMSCTFDLLRPPRMPSKVRRVARSVAQILSSVEETGATIRLIGLGQVEGSWDGISPSRDQKFRLVLREEYVKALRRVGLKADEARQRAEELEYESLARYSEERDFLPF